MAVDIREKLKVLQLSGVRVEGNELGRGSYGVVVEVTVNGLHCAAKKLHPILLETSREECSKIIYQFVEECFQHSRQRHPKIVQLLGVHFPSPQDDLPLMVLELMDMTLSKCLNKYSTLPLTLKNDMLIDVAQGLLHLHNQEPPIIHRDLTSNNVLLNSHFVAKISDLGVAKIIKDNQLSRQMTKQPGTIAYMPPEASLSKPSYNTKLDVFSFGVLTLHVSTNKWPVPTEEFVSKEGSTDVYCRVSEVERRKIYFAKLGAGHVHTELIQKCLHNNPASRPDTLDILTRLQSVEKNIGSYPTRHRLIAQQFQSQEQTAASSSPSSSSSPLSSISSTSSVTGLSGTAGYEIVAGVKPSVTSVKPPKPPPKPVGRKKAKVVEAEETTVVALYSFGADHFENLTFEKWDVLKILHKSNSYTWLAYSVRTGKEGWIPSNHVCPEEWYFGRIRQADAHRRLLLCSTQTGSFLIRESDIHEDNFSLVVRSHHQIKHYRIYLNAEGGFYITSIISCHSIDELIRKHMESSNGLCCTLTVPCPKDDLPLGDNWTIERSHVTFKQCISSDQFGETWEGAWKKMSPVAVKIHSSHTLTGEKFLAVATLMRKFNNENLLQVYGVCQRQPFFVVTEYMKHGQLLDYLQKRESQKFEVQELASISAQIANGMAYLEARQYIHRDLAARNIQVAERNRVKIADFSLTMHISDTCNAETYIPIKWTAPEAAKNSKFTTKSDVWSYGILLMEIFTHGRRPYPGIFNKDLLPMLEKGYRMLRPKQCPAEVYQIMMACWNYDPFERPTFERLKYTFENMVL